MKLKIFRKTEKTEFNLEIDTNNSSIISIKKDMMSKVIDILLWLATVISIVKYLIFPL